MVKHVEYLPSDVDFATKPHAAPFLCLVIPTGHKLNDLVASISCCDDFWIEPHLHIPVNRLLLANKAAHPLAADT